VGEGRDLESLKQKETDTIEFLGGVPDHEMAALYKGAAFLFASVDEEFGIAPIEAMGYGVPVIAYKSGGLIETVHEGKNGYLYTELTAESIGEKIKMLEKLSEKDYTLMSRTARRESEQYSEEQFARAIRDFVQSKQP
jgi:glycosyltransferase involved in cell wall biosynthesis